MTNKHTIPDKILFSISTLATLILATGTVTDFVTQSAAAQNASMLITTDQTQTCDTAGSVSPVSSSCNGSTSNNIANSPISHVRYECPTGTPFTFNIVGTTCISLTIVGKPIELGILEGLCTGVLHGQSVITQVGLNSGVQCKLPATAA